MKILSIDFDWVMEPFIQAYNHYCKTSKSGPDETWEHIKEAIPAFQSSIPLEMDYKKYADLYFFLRGVCSNNPKAYIYLGSGHNEIVPIIREVHQRLGGTLEIVNIDHHHDRGYKLTDEEEFKNRAYDCTNWLYYLTKYYQIDKCTWVRNKNSEIELYHDLPADQEYITLTELKDLDMNESYDLIFICSSYDWVPLKYRPLFYILTENPGKATLQ